MLYIFTVFQLSQYFSINFLYFELIIDSHCMYTFTQFTPVVITSCMGFLCGSVVKNPPAIQETQETWFHPWVRKIPWSRKWQPTRISCLESPMDRGAWQATVHEMAKSQTPLSDLHFHFTLMTYQAARAVKPLLANAGDARDSGSIPGSERSTGGGHGNPLQYSCWEDPTDTGAWWAAAHRVAKS